MVLTNILVNIDRWPYGLPRGFDHPDREHWDHTTRFKRLKDTPYPEWTYPSRPDWANRLVVYHNQVWPDFGFPYHAGEGEERPMPTSNVNVALQLYERQLGGGRALAKTLTGMTQQLLENQLVDMVGYPCYDRRFEERFTTKRPDELERTLHLLTVGFWF